MRYLRKTFVDQKAIRARRESQGLTVSDVARMAHMSLGTAYTIDRGAVAGVSAHNLAHYCSVVKMPSGTIFRYEKET